MRTLQPEDAGYEQETSGFNLAIAHRPDVVVPAESAEDVIAAVRHAADAGLPVAVMGAGHAPGLPAEGGLLITTRRMNGVTIDATARTARVEGGARWADVIGPASEHGLAALSGSSPGVGVVGYTLGGGIGLMSRTYGFAADRVRALEVVTADGRLRQVDADQEADLFWALRGGKVTLGVVTSMTFDLLPQASVFAGSLIYPGDAARQVFAAYLDWTRGLTEETTTSVALLRPPGAPPVVAVRVVHTGADGDRVVAPMRAAAPVLADDLRDMPYRDTHLVYNDPEGPMPSWGRGVLLDDVDVDAVLAAADESLVIVEIRHLGGAMAHDAGNAVGWRDAAYCLSTHTIASPEGAKAGDTLMSVAGPRPAPVNFLGLTGDALREQLRGAWQPETVRRLAEIRRAYDPSGVFRFGHPVE
ncbi:FAD-binding oxidoreductase [Microtetraspora niveoalba]|uniref:FAD-binding oxidoreductase n=1 Tax=Microtetraspora niveoalba TaxID=46175 RepID=UPI00082EB996|nr:FAD-binding oxidoreductase [Microtetraspora niveoalba]